MNTKKVILTCLAIFCATVFFNVKAEQTRQGTITLKNTVESELPFKDLRIKCLDMDDTGIGSSYKNHTFMLDDNELQIDSYRWTFFLKNKAGTYESISTGNSSTFTIEKITNQDQYHINVNGDLDGKIECTYSAAGKELSAEPFKVTLEQKPQILSISDINQTWDNYNFTLDFNVEYAGAERFYIEIEEEYCYNVRTQRIDKPFFAHVTTGKISGLYYSWVTVEVSNQYGTSRQTLEFPPYFGENNINIISNFSSEDSEIKVYNLGGDLVFDGKSCQFIPGNLPPGIYIRKEKLSSGDILTKKMIIK